ncbi:MAG: ABC transporter ATP-binding protein [Bacteroidetes bacterium]|nr:ABC transporter ATP-binding protein [Pseudomonadota bacterium]MBU1423974.1 ABC transporter ATP-binding protein [Bacteroidota bacterium]
MLEVKGLQFRHHHGEDDILKGIAFGANMGQITTILGPNGSGKTTVFKCIAGLWKPQRGEILFGNKNISNLPCEKRAKMLAIVPQEHEPSFAYSVLDAVLMGRVSHVGVFSSPSKYDYLKAEEAIETVGIAHLKEKAYTKISGGERQLVLVARALAQEAPVMLLDEPTSHLDFRNQVLILSKVREIARQKGITVLMTLHDPNLAMVFSDKAVMVNEGCIASNGTPESVITEDNLKRVYGIDVAVINWNGTKVVCPRVERYD